MVKAPAALVPCCKTIPPLWEAVEFPLSMVQMTPACKPFTEMLLDSVSAAGRGRGRGWEWGVVSSGCHFSSLGVLYCPLCCPAITGKCWFFCTFNPACGCVSKVESAPGKGTALSRQRVEDPCVGGQVNLTVYTSPGLFPGRICQAWLVFTLAIWSFISQPHTCCSTHLDRLAFAFFLVNRCYLSRSSRLPILSMDLRPQ